MIDYQSENVEDAIKKITDGKLIDIWIDTVSKESVEQGLKNLAYGAELALIVDNANYDNKLF